MELYYLLVQRSLWTVHLLINFLVLAEGRFAYKRQLIGRQPPVILPTEQNVTVHRHDTAILECTVNHRGTKNVQWSLTNSSHPLSINNSTWTSDKQFSVTYKRYNESLESWDLVIDNAQPRHSNSYECQISSIVTHMHRVYLTVLPTVRQVSPKVTVQGTTLLESHQTINLTCKARGAHRAPEAVDWFHDGKIIRPHEEQWRSRILIDMKVARRSLISHLSILRSRLEDSGAYICRSSDREFDSIDVHILEDSDPPNRPPRTNAVEIVEAPRSFSKMYTSEWKVLFFVLTFHMSKFIKL